MLNRRAFTLFELVVTVALISILAAIALPAFFDIGRRAEVAGIRSTLADMRLALTLKVAKGIMHDADIKEWAHNGAAPLYPMRDTLREAPASYAGVSSSASSPGTWYDDRSTHELVYVPRNSNLAHSGGKPLNKLRWRIELQAEDKRQVNWLTLRPTRFIEWQ
jgi:prepilin-type N-terminal cleavage/methylation domain-containing protein